MTNKENINQSKLDILNDIEFLSEIINQESIPFGEQVKAAAILQELILICNTCLLPFKQKLREMGKASGDSKFEAFSTDGDVIAAVISPKSSYRLSGAFNVADALKLPEFNALVEEKTSYKLKKGAVETILSMSGENRDQWMQLIESSKPTPRVSLNFIK
tara:strand:+ start:1536 stop:2015 length:480 start_codon:yes stop_codon:yes gene_type:complete